MLARLSQDRLDGLLRREGPTAGPEKEGEGVPDVARELQGDQLEQPQSETAQQDKAFTSLPRPLDGREIVHRRRFEQGILFGAAGMAGQAFGPEAIPKGPDHAFQHREHRLHPDAGAIEGEGGEGIEAEVATHEDNRPATGDGKDKAQRAVAGFPQQIEGQIRDGFDPVVDLRRRRTKLGVMGLKDLGEGDLGAIFPGPAPCLAWQRLRFLIGHIILFGAGQDMEIGLLERDRPARGGQGEDGAGGKKGV